MSHDTPQGSSRRTFLKNSGRVAAATALVGSMVPKVHAGEDNTLQVALIGCGGRGTGAASNALSVTNAPTKLVAMGDVFPERMETSYNGLKPQFGDKVDVPDERKFIGFDSLSKGHGLPAARRHRDLRHAAGLPLGALRLRHRKGPERLHGEADFGRRANSKRMLKLADEAAKKNLKVGVGLMCRHCRARQELFHRIQDGEIGTSWIDPGVPHGGPPTETTFSEPKPPEATSCCGKSNASTASSGPAAASSATP